MAQIVERSQSLKREDISDVLIMAKTDETPFLSMVKKGSEVSNTLTQYPIDLPVAPKTAGVVDEQDVTNFENLSADRTKLSARLQIFERAPKVSRLADKVSDVAGVGKGKEFARNLAKAGEAIKLDMETRFLSDIDSQADDGTVGYETRGISKWISSTAQTDLPVPTSYLTPAGNIYTGAQASFTEELFKGLLQSRYSTIGRKGNLVGLFGPSLQAYVDSWSLNTDTVASKTVVRRFNGDTSDKTITNMVQYMVTSFGEVELYTHRYLFYTQTGGVAASQTQTSKGGLVLDMDMIDAAFNENPTKIDLPNQGGGPRALLEAIVALRCLNPMAHCKINCTS